MSGYDLLDLDVNIIGTANRLTYMDISNNKIANIGADVFKSANLERINLANNNLSRTDPFDATFSALFSKNTRLWEVTLAGNQLNHVPKDIFHSNSKLRSVYLSENEFSQISFALGHLKHLTLLDMKKNKIRYLDKMSRNNIDELHKSQQTQANNSKTNNTLVVDLRGNPFSCDCEALDFLQWFTSSPLFTSKIENNVYFCETNGKKISMNENAVQASMDNCERPRRKRRMILLSSITSSIALVILTICIVLAVKRRKRRLLQRRYNERVRLLQEDETDFRFLVFLSFASEDDTFVEHHVITPLKLRQYVNMLMQYSETFYGCKR